MLLYFNIWDCLGFGLGAVLFEKPFGDTCSRSWRGQTNQSLSRFSLEDGENTQQGLNWRSTLSEKRAEEPVATFRSSCQLLSAVIHSVGCVGLYSGKTECLCYVNSLMLLEETLCTREACCLHIDSVQATKYTIYNQKFESANE